MFGRSFVRMFVSLDQNVAPTHLFRDKGAKGQREKETKGQRDKETKGQYENRTMGQWNNWKKGTM